MYAVISLHADCVCVYVCMYVYVCVYIFQVHGCQYLTRVFTQPSGALVHACNLANCWFTWAFEVNNQTNSTLNWEKGGFQGAEGFDSAGDWW